MGIERRRAPRYQFVADAEVLETASGARCMVKTGDLSLGGCFLDMLNPSVEGIEIRITIWRAARSFTALGRVVFVFPRLGMGVAFTRIAPQQLTTLEEWLAELESHRGAIVSVDAISGQGGRS
jgi:hypothetical protein